MGCDTICDLPDALLTQILLNLETKESVRASVLSTRWRNLWLSVPGLDLTTRHFPKEEVFAKFVERFMEFNNGSHLQNDIDPVTIPAMEWIGTVVDGGIQHLDVYMSRNDAFIPMNIYKSKTLVSLKLVNVELKNPEFVVSLPCLKIMHLDTIRYGNDGPLIVEKLISGCPLLEDLKLVRPFERLNQNVVLFLHVRSQPLQRFVIMSCGTDFTVEIDAPRLEYLSLSEGLSNKIVAKNLSSLFTIDLDCNITVIYGQSV